MENTIFVAFKGEKNKIVEMTVQEAWDRFGSRVSEGSYKIETKISYEVQVCCFGHILFENKAKTVFVNKTNSFERKELLEEIEDLTEGFRINIEDYIDDISDKPLKIEVTPLKWFAMFETFEGRISKCHRITDWCLTEEEAREEALECFYEMLFSYENEIIIEQKIEAYSVASFTNQNEIIIEQKNETYSVAFFTNQEDAEGFLNFIK